MPFRYRPSQVLRTLAASLLFMVTASNAADPVEQALSEVRDVKADMFSRHSSVLGDLPGPAEFAAAQMRTRPIPRPQSDRPGTVAFTDQQEQQFAHMAVARHKDDPRCRPAIPIMAAYIRHTANTVPIRGFFSDSAQHVPLQVMKAQWDNEVQQMENVVPAICCGYVRTSTPPIKSYRGWHEMRLTAQELLEKLSPSAAPALRSAIAEQEKWLAEVDDAHLNLTLQLGPEEARQTAIERIDYLKGLAEKLKQ